MLSMEEGCIFGALKAMRKLHITELNRKDAQEFKQADKWPVRLILDNVRSLHNIGSIFRTADAFLCERIYLCGISATPPNREIHKSALGAENSVEWLYFAAVEEAVKRCKEEGYTIIIAEQTTESIFLNEFKTLPEKTALVLGNEVNGVSDEVLPHTDIALEIPQFGTKHSFNVSVCAGIFLYHLSALPSARP